MRPAREFAACAGIAVAGISIGIGGSTVWPWGFAPAPGTMAVQDPRPGMLLLSADGVDGATVPANTVRHYGPPALARGTAIFVRGVRTGRIDVLVECSAPRQMMIGSEPATTWKPSGDNITDMIGQALCHAHPQLQARRAGVDT